MSKMRLGTQEPHALPKNTNITTRLNIKYARCREKEHEEKVTQ